MFSIEEINEFFKIRRNLHSYPELKYQEFRTAKLIKNFLIKVGFDEIKTGLGETGLVGVLKGNLESRNQSQKSIGIRADMDALPIYEENMFAHASKNKGVMHACGHDGHSTILLAAAKKLSENRNFNGKVHFIFQPAEEGGGGAKAMMDDGLFKRYPMDEIYALHNWPGMKEGTFGFKSGPIMASSNQFEIVIQGKSGHAAMPHLCVDPVIVASHFIQYFQSITSRLMDPIEPAVISVSKVVAGESANIISDECKLLGTVRTFNFDVLDKIEKLMIEACLSIPKLFGAKASLNFVRQYPPTINYKDQTNFAIKIAEKLVGKNNVFKEVQPSMGAEDFAFMLGECPGTYFFLGNGELKIKNKEVIPRAKSCSLHNSKYDFNDNIIAIGAEFWVSLIHSRLGKLTDN